MSSNRDVVRTGKSPRAPSIASEALRGRFELTSVYFIRYSNKILLDIDRSQSAWKFSSKSKFEQEEQERENLGRQKGLDSCRSKKPRILPKSGQQVFAWKPIQRRRNWIVLQKDSNAISSCRRCGLSRWRADQRARFMVLSFANFNEQEKPWGIARIARICNVFPDWLWFSIGE